MIPFVNRISLQTLLMTLIIVVFLAATALQNQHLLLGTDSITSNKELDQYTVHFTRDPLLRGFGSFIEQLLQTQITMPAQIAMSEDEFMIRHGICVIVNQLSPRGHLR